MWDTVVLGMGGVGSFALRAVARETKGSVLGIDRFTCGHDKGSSHGKSWVYRRAYFEHANYIPWIDFSLDELRKLEKEQNVSIVEECGVLLVAPKSSSLELLNAAKSSAKEHNTPIEELKS